MAKIKTKILQGEVELTSPYGMRSGVMHDGIDLAAYYQPISPTKRSTVKLVAYDQYGGLYIWLKHLDAPTGEWSLHHSKSLVYVGQTVEVGQSYAVTGNTGYSTGPHVHFSYLQDGNNFRSNIDPLPFILIDAPSSEPSQPSEGLVLVGNTSDGRYNSLSLISRDLFNSPNWFNPVGWEEVLNSNPHLRTGNYNNIPAGQNIFKPSSSQPAPNPIPTPEPPQSSEQYFTVIRGPWRSNVIEEIIDAGIWQGSWHDNSAVFDSLNPVTPQGGWKAGQQVRIK